MHAQTTAGVRLSAQLFKKCFSGACEQPRGRNSNTVVCTPLWIRRDGACHQVGLWPQLRAIGGPVGRAALRLEALFGRDGPGHSGLSFGKVPRGPSGCKRQKPSLNAHGSCEQAGPVGWDERVSDA